LTSQSVIFIYMASNHTALTIKVGICTTTETSSTTTTGTEHQGAL
jgi:hypothetical protein